MKVMSGEVVVAKILESVIRLLKFVWKVKGKPCRVLLRL